MSERFCSLIILGPGAPRTVKLHLSRGAITILILAFLLSFLAVIWVGYTFPTSVNELSRTELEEENRVLKLETSNATLGIMRLDAKVAELEELSKRIEVLVEPTSQGGD
jgi:Tfp pilus assembly protein PilO